MEGTKSSNLADYLLDKGFATRSIHAGEHVGQLQHTSHTSAIYQTSTFVFKSVEEGAKCFSGEQDGYMYTRLGNPSVRLLEAKINALEGAKLKQADPNLTISTFAFATGMAAISHTFLALANKDDTIILGDVLYGATEHLVFNVLNRFGIKAVEVDPSNLVAVEKVIRAHPQAKFFHLETPTNPLLVVADIQAISEIIKKYAPEMKLIVDNTFCTPYLQRPLELGADVVVHSTTKYICGHGTVVGGLATTADIEIRNKIFTVIKDVGATPSPFDSWLVNLGLKTLPLRMDRHCQNAHLLANYLTAHPKVEKVFYPGLESSPSYQVAKRQMDNFGGMVSFELHGGLVAGKTLLNNIKLFTLAVSLGSIDSLISHPASMTHACVPKSKREQGGLTDGLVRVSVGLENIEDLIAAMEQALNLC